jgi:hypothetical protein
MHIIFLSLSSLNIHNPLWQGYPLGMINHYMMLRTALRHSMVWILHLAWKEESPQQHLFFLLADQLALQQDWLMERCVTWNLAVLAMTDSEVSYSIVLGCKAMDCVSSTRRCWLGDWWLLLPFPQHTHLSITIWGISDSEMSHGCRHQYRIWISSGGSKVYQ